MVVVGRSTIGIVLGSRCRWLLVVNDRRMGIVLGGRWPLSLVVGRGCWLLSLVVDRGCWSFVGKHGSMTGIVLDGRRC